MIFERLQQASLTLKARKCKLFGKSVEFLGQIISETGVETDRFVYRFAEIAKPLHKLTEKNKLFIRTEEC